MRFVPRFVVRWVLRRGMRKAHRDPVFRAEMERGVLAAALADRDMPEFESVRWEWPDEEWRGPVLIVDGERIDTTEMLYSDAWMKS